MTKKKLKRRMKRLEGYVLSLTQGAVKLGLKVHDLEKAIGEGSEEPGRWEVTYHKAPPAEDEVEDEEGPVGWASGTIGLFYWEVYLVPGGWRGVALVNDEEDRCTPVFRTEVFETRQFAVDSLTQFFRMIKSSLAEPAWPE